MGPTFYHQTSMFEVVTMYTYGSKYFFALATWNTMDSDSSIETDKKNIFQNLFLNMICSQT